MAEIVVSEGITGAAMDQLRQEYDVLFDADLWRDEKSLRKQCRRARALIVRNQTQVDQALLQSAAELVVVGRAGVGLDNIDVDAASQQGIVVSFTPHENSISVAELALGLMLSLARAIPAADRDTRCGGWNRRQFTGVELWDATLGVVGLGRIGQLTAARARALGMKIIAHDDYVDPASPSVTNLEARMMGLDQLLQEADVVTCHVPLTEETVGYFDYDRFCRMKPTAVFINTSRGEVVNEDGLIRALREGKLGGAALDVRQQEPPAKSELAEMDNVILTPHIAAFTRQAQGRVVDAVCGDVRRVLAGEEAKNYSNFATPRR